MKKAYSLFLLNVNLMGWLMQVPIILTRVPITVMVSSGTLQVFSIY